MTKLQIDENEVKKVEYDLAGHSPREIEEVRIRGPKSLD